VDLRHWAPIVPGVLAVTHYARTGEALADMLQRTLYEFEDGTNDDPEDRASYSPDSRLP